MTTQTRVRTYTHCEHCGKRKTPPAKSGYVPKVEYERDEFCSADCCRAHHGVELSKPAPRGSGMA